MAVCLLRDVTKSYRTGFTMRSKVALQQVTLEVESGETYAYLGHNGAGKSTTIKALLGLVRVDSGQVSVFGQPITQPRLRRRIGYLPENPYFYDHLSGQEILQLAADLHGMPRAQTRQRIGEVLELVGMAQAARQRLRTYSKGMLQRIGLAQALINDPDLLFLDEPMSGLDPVGRHQIREILGELRRRGKTLFMSSHILYDVETIADRAAILSEGRLRRVVRLADLRSQSRRLEVQCRGLAESAVAQLATRGLRVQRDGNVGRIQVEDDAQLPEILAALRSHGAQLLGVLPQRQTLEEIFLAEVGSPAAQAPPGAPTLQAPAPGAAREAAPRTGVPQGSPQVAVPQGASPLAPAATPPPPARGSDRVPVGKA